MLSKRIANTTIYTLFTITIIIMLLTNRMTLFLHPKMIKYIIIALLVIMCLGYFEYEETCHLVNTHKYYAEKLSIGYVVYIVFFILLALRPTELSNAAIKNKNSDFYIDLESTLENTITNVAEENNNFQDISLVPLEDAEFMDLIYGVSRNPSEYEGKNISVEGFVYRDDSFNSDVFVVGRMLVSCCIADSTVTGVFIQMENASDLEEGTWVRAEGIASIENVYFPEDAGYYNVFMLSEVSITEIEPYPSKYVY